MPIRVLLVDDHDAFRQSVAAMLQNTHDMVVAGEASTLSTAIALVPECRPDVVLLDLHLPDGNGLDAIADILQRAPRTAVMILTMYGDKRYVRRALQAGACAYLLKDVGVDDLCDSIRGAQACGSR